MQDFESFYSSLNQIETQQQITSNDVNRLVDKMNDCFLNCAEKSFGKIGNENENTSKARHGMDRTVKVSVESGTAPSTDKG